MVKIAVAGVEAALERGVDHVVRLFFETVDVVFDPPEAGAQVDADAWLTVAVGDGDAGEAAARAALVTADGASFDAAAARPQGKLRYAVHDAVLQVLEQWTGIVQPWGVLTGIRPTKLMHQAVQAGQAPEAIAAMLGAEYKVKPDKIALMAHIVERQLTAIPDLYNLKDAVSVYIGIPFCPTKCAYCTFPAYDIRGSQGSVDGFLAGLHYEIEQTGAWLTANNISVTTVYFGGGTPTSISAEEMDKLYANVFKSFPYSDQIREITVEAGRPDTITPDKLDVLNKYGIHRISINPQSYTQTTLDTIGRHHTVDETIATFQLARQHGMDNINMDLIIGLPDEHEAEFVHSLAETAKLQPESLTVHTLSFKRASEMTQNRTKFTVASRAEVAAMMAQASAWTAQQGYVPYYLYRQKNILGNLENVGYAKPGMESLYNIIIMEEMQTIIGLGCGAASKWIHRDGTISRYANPKDPKSYNDTVEHHTQAKLQQLSTLFEL